MRCRNASLFYSSVAMKFGRFKTMGRHEAVMGAIAEGELGGTFAARAAVTLANLPKASQGIEGSIAGVNVSFYGWQSGNIRSLLTKVSDVTRLGHAKSY